MTPTTVSNHLAPPVGQTGWLKLTPLNKRRLTNFKANKRGYWSFWIFMTLFIISMLSNIFANDRPIIAYYKGEILFPVFIKAPPTKSVSPEVLVQKELMEASKEPTLFQV